MTLPPDTLYALPSLIAGLSALGLAFYVYRQKRHAQWFLVLTLCGALWSLTEALETFSGTHLGYRLAWIKIQYIAIVLVPVTWLTFIFQYTGRERWLHHWVWRLSLLVPALTLLFIFTNESHHLLWFAADLDTAGAPMRVVFGRGLWFLVHVVYSYSLCLLSLHLLVLALRRVTPMYRMQVLALLVALVLPWGVNILNLLLSPTELLARWDLTPTAFALSTYVVGWAIWRYHLLEVMPFYRESLIDALNDALVVLNVRHQIVDYNRAAQKLLHRLTPEVIGQPAARFFNFHPELAQTGMLTEPKQLEVTLEGRQYEGVLTPLWDSRKHYNGRLVVLRDVTERIRAANELRSQKDLFENLVAVARVTTEGATLSATLQNALNVAATLTGAERGSLFLLDETGTVTHGLLTYGGMTPAAQATIVQRVMDKGLAGWLVRHRKPALIADTSADERWLFSPNDPHPARSALGVAIVSGNTLVGVLTLAHSQACRFTEDHLQLMQAAADQMALALRNAQIYDAQHRMANRQATLYGVLRAMEEEATPHRAAQAAVEAIVRLANGGQAHWPGVSLAVKHSTEPRWEIVAASGSMALPIGYTAPFTQGIIGRTYTSKQAQYVADVQADPDYLALHPSCRSELAVPLERGGRVLGVLNLESDQLAAFEQEDRLLAESLADAIALMLANAALYQTIVDERSHLQALITASRDGIVLVSSTLHILVMNETALEFLLLPGTPESWVGRPLMTALLALRATDRTLTKTLMHETRRVLEVDSQLTEGDITIRSRDVHWMNVPVVSDGQPMGRLLVLRDITEEKLLQQMREDLANTMVHDLRNPLANMRMALDLLHMSDLGGDANNVAIVQIAQNNIQRMLTMVNAILDASRLESGEMPLDREPLDLNRLIHEALQHQFPLAKEKEMRLQYAVPDLPCVWADAALMRRVLENLVGNALKFTPEGGQIVVTGQLLASTAPPAFVQISIQDNGPGIPPEMRERLFKKFSTGRHHARGSGLGLVFCRLALEAHGGRIWVGDPTETGTEFNFTLPVYQES